MLNHYVILTARTRIGMIPATAPASSHLSKSISTESSHVLSLAPQTNICIQTEVAIPLVHISQHHIWERESVRLDV